MTLGDVDYCIFCDAYIFGDKPDWNVCNDCKPIFELIRHELSAEQLLQVAEAIKTRIETVMREAY